nr:MAG TPA: hypothetical protein [Caudoviricetes sp.]
MSSYYFICSFGYWQSFLVGFLWEFRCSIRHRPTAAVKAVFTAIILNMVYNGSSNLRFKPQKAGKPYRNTLQYNLYNVAI